MTPTPINDIASDTIKVTVGSCILYFNTANVMHINEFCLGDCETLKENQCGNAGRHLRHFCASGIEWNA